MFGDIYIDRRYSIYGYVSSLANGFGLLPLTLIYISVFKNKLRNQIIILIMVGITSIGTNSRWIIGGYLIVLINFLIGGVSLKNDKLYSKRIIGFSIMMLVILYIFSSFFSYKRSDFIQERLFKETSIKDSTRYKAFTTFKMFFPQNYLFGTGLHLTAEIEKVSNRFGSSQIHVGYLSHLVSYGITGSLLLFYFWFRFTKVLFLKSKYSGFDAGFYSLIIFLWANLTLVKYSFYEYGLLFAFIFSKYFFDKAKLINRAEPSAVPEDSLSLLIPEYSKYI